MLGLIGGTSLTYLDFFQRLTKREVQTPFGKSWLFLGDGQRYALILRHGENHHIPPHRVNVRANLTALKKIGVKRVIGLSSVGSMKRTIPIGSIVIPDDFIQLSDISTIYDSFEDEPKHVVPELNEDFRKEVITLLRNNNLKVIDGGVYMHTRGPRLETKAEIKMFSRFADICGMTMANEAVIAQEIGLPYINISIVDNMAHGILKEKISIEKIFENVKRNTKTILKIVKVLLDEAWD